MIFVIRMAVREIRASWQRLLFFFVCIAVGVASIVAIRSVIQSVRQGLTREARAMTGADVVVRSDRPLGEAVRAAVARERSTGRVGIVSEAVELATMVRPAGVATTRMVELRAVESTFPLYGTMTLQGKPYSHDLLRDHGVLVRPELLAQLNLRVGENLLIGTRQFQIRGVIQSEPGRNLGAFSLGSRVFIDLADLPSTGLLSFGSRASHQLLLQVPSPPPLPGRRDPSLLLASELSKTFVNDFVGVRSYRQNEGRMNQNLSRAENYLSLVGLVVLILGGIGVSSVTRVFVQQKVRSIAILKCVGSSSRQVLAIYLTQVVLLGLAGSALGVVIAAGVLQLLPVFVGDIAALLQVEYGLTVGAVLQGLAVGLLVSLLFSVVPLLEVRNVKPSLLLRQDIPSLPQFDWLKWTVATAVGAALVGVAAWQAGSVQVGLLLSGGFVALTFVLHLAGIALIRAVQPLRFARSFALRQAVLHVARPGNQTRIILLAVGLGTFFILGVRALQVNLLQDFSVQVGEDAPDMFLMDIQSDQRAGLTALIDRENGAENVPKLIPVLRARITGVRGREVNLESYEDVRERGGLSREFTITYRSALEANEKLVDGKWWDETPAGEQAEVSIEESLRERFNIQIGDEMRFDVLGRIISARVTSFREVDFRDFRAGGFMIVFRPGPFDNAPHSFIAAVKGGKDPAARARLQGLIVSGYPNISVIDLREVLDTIRTIVDNVTLAVTVVGALVLLSGSLILIGAVSMTKFRRVYEAAILKTLGASSRLIATMLLLEYGVLGAIAGTVGAAGAIALSWAVARYGLDLPWQPAPFLTLGGIIVTAGAVAAIGVLASLDVLRHKPLSTLRAE
ncbi:MAG TPA: FtsX-like permease family protein [Vicinamibacterales bacterium]|nr:FtsX-like permease family protein [Vicinamibacterales bacterium]